MNIQIYYDAISFWCYLKITYEQKVEPDSLSGLGADDLMEKLSPWLPKDVILDKKEFINKLKNSQDKQSFGELMGGFQIFGKGKCHPIFYKIMVVLFQVLKRYLHNEFQNDMGVKIL